jgi:PAS domain S-box-containing protein
MHTITGRQRHFGEADLHHCVFRSILDQMVDLAVVIDPFGTLLYLNPAARSTLGSAAPGTGLELLLDGVHPEDKAAIRVTVDDLLSLAGELPPRTVDYRRRDGSGGWRIFEAVLQRLRGDDADLVLAVIRDVTEQRAHEAQRSEGQAFEVAAQASGAVARDFGALLLSFGRHLDLLAGSSLVDAHGRMREMRETLDGAWALVEQLQSFGSPQDQQPAPLVDINDALEELAPHFERLVGASTEVIQLLGASNPRIGMSRADLEELLSALVLRARDAIRAGIPPRPRALGVKSRVTVVTRDAERAGGQNGHPAREVILEVTDTGTPTSSEERAQLESGSHLDGDSRLDRVHGLVQKAGGRLNVESDAAGTVVRVQFPVASTSLNEAPA